MGRLTDGFLAIFLCLWCFFVGLCLLQGAKEWLTDGRNAAFLMGLIVLQNIIFCPKKGLVLGVWVGARG